jgi:glycosyltransferase involved in cell wall biosynthesis
MKKRIAFVVQRYGLEVNGGSELHCRLIAERLTNQYHVEVLTTKAVDYITWENHYQNDIDLINGVTVRRFTTDHPRDMTKFNEYTGYLMSKPDRTLLEEYEWMRLQGPASFRLLKFLDTHYKDYDAIIFYTYLYFTTFFGLKIAPIRSVFIPTAHDEPPIYFSMFRSIFHIPKYILFLTPEEKNFVHSHFENQHIPNDVSGIGIDIPDNILSEPQFRAKFQLQDDFVIYVGRIDESKGCKELFDYFLKFKSEYPSDLKLVLLGRAVMDLPKHPDIIPLGFVSDEDKFGAMRAAKALIMPSKFESLSMVVLESMYMETPVLVNGQCEVLRGHCERGNGGLYYFDYEEFKVCLSFLCNQKEINKKLGAQGKRYVEKNYSWAVILEKFVNAIEAVSNL